MCPFSPPAPWGWLQGGGGAPWGFGGGARAEGRPFTLSLAPRELDLTLQITLSVMVTLLFLDLKGRGNLSMQREGNEEIQWVSPIRTLLTSAHSSARKFQPTPAQSGFKFQARREHGGESWVPQPLQLAQPKLQRSGPQGRNSCPPLPNARPWDCSARTAMPSGPSGPLLDSHAAPQASLRANLGSQRDDNQQVREKLVSGLSHQQLPSQCNLLEPCLLGAEALLSTPQQPSRCA